MTLLEKTIKLLNSSEKSPAAIAKETGLKPRWMYMVSRNELADPSVNKIELIYNYLVAEQNKAA